MIAIDPSAPQGPNSEIGTWVRTVLPAGSLDQATVAWEVDKVNESGPHASLGIGVLGPVGAVQARTTDHAGKAGTVPLKAGGGFIPLHGPVPAGAKVELLGADGTVLATTAVLPFAAKLPTGVPGD